MFKIGQAVKIKGLIQEVRYTIAEIKNGKYYLRTPSGEIMRGEFTSDELDYYYESDKVKTILGNYEKPTAFSEPPASVSEAGQKKPEE